MKRCLFVPALFLGLFGVVEVLLVMTLLLGLGAAAMAQGPPPATPPPAETPPTPETASALSRVEAEALKAEMEKALRDVERAQSVTQDEASRILGLMEDFLGFLAVALTIVGVIVALIFGVLSFLGYREWRYVQGKAKTAEKAAQRAEGAGKRAEDAEKRLTEAAAKAEEAAKKASSKAEETEKRLSDAATIAEAAAQRTHDARSKAEEAERRLADVATTAEAAAQKAQDARTTAERYVELIDSWRTSLDSAWKDINNHFQELPILESEEVDGVDTPPLSLETSATFEDGDVVLVVCDRLNIPANKAESAGYFLKLARYWRIRKNYPRAHARVERALALAPDMPDALRHLARTLTHWAETLPEDSPERLERLNRALAALEDTRQLQKQEDEGLLFDEAYTRDIMGDFDAAASLYQKAREVNRKNATEKQEERWYLTYNLACALSLSGRLAEAFKEIIFFLEKWPERWKFVEKDPHLENIRLTSPWKDELQDLTKKAKEQSGG